MGDNRIQGVEDKLAKLGLRVSIIICTFNEADNLPHVLLKIPDWVDEVILVDGHSTDNTVEAAKKLRPDIKVFYEPEKGKDIALRYGVERANGDIIITLDADGSTDPQEIPKFIEPLLEGYDFAKGSRFKKEKPLKMPWLRRFGNWILVTEANVLFGTKFTDLCSGYNAFWKNAWQKIGLSGSFTYEPIIVLMAKKAGLKIVEVPCQDRGRICGSSKLPNWKQGWGAFKAILKERFRG
jgi:glycosyltransferase involved in cell wall biosynthesis